jgi:pimeloyl-ACP methyl ester carboxylesterase
MKLPPLRLISTPTLGVILLASLLLVSCTEPVAQDPVESLLPLQETGNLGAAPYRIDVPENWNGDLVMFLHGYRPQGTPSPAPMPRDNLAEDFVRAGYAFAASDYSRQGWAVAEAMADNEALRQHFIAVHGRPRHTYLMGLSMGGHIVLALLERQPDDYDGALSLCGANAPAPELIASGVLLPLLAFDYYFPGVMGLAPGGLEDPNSPVQLNGEAIEATLASHEDIAQMLSARFEVPRDDLAGALYFHYMIIRELQQRAGGFPIDNHATIYSGFGNDADFNARVRRYTGQPAAIAYLAHNANLSGQVSRPVVIQSNRLDPTVTRPYAERYAQLAAATGQILTLPPVRAGHCSFTSGDVTQAFGYLARWVTEGKRPAQP